MISINLCNSNVSDIKNSHVTFVGSRVLRVINFYTQIFTLLISIENNKRYGRKKIINDIKSIKQNTNSGDYKKLLEGILKGKHRIPNENFSYIIRYPEKRNRKANDLKKVLNCLKQLSTDYKKILEFEFDGDIMSSNIKYQGYKDTFVPIEFILKNIFDYDDWFSKLDSVGIWGPYQLTSELNINCCPYCNRSYTFTVSNLAGKKISRPELDHFMPKAKNPLLALSFFNLIPSCHICNSSGVKGSLPIDYITHLNPYESNPKHALTRFTYTPTTYEGSIGLTNEIDISLKYNGDDTDHLLQSKVEGNIDLFCINEIYSNHKDSVQEIIWLREMSGDQYLSILNLTFENFPISPDDAYRLAYRNYFNEADFSKRPLSKLTKDIAIELHALIKY